MKEQESFVSPARVLLFQRWHPDRLLFSVSFTEQLPVPLLLCFKGAKIWIPRSILVRLFRAKIFLDSRVFFNALKLLE